MPIVGIEWIILGAFIIILLLVGPKKIPELARGIGRAIAEFRRGRQGSENEKGD